VRLSFGHLRKWKKGVKLVFTENKKRKKKKEKIGKIGFGRRDDCWSSQKENRVPELLNC
jgi:hypothetical protein